MKKKRWKGLISSLAIFGACISLSGCSATMANVYQKLDAANLAFDNVRDRNIDFIKDLKDLGFLSAKDAESWISSVTLKVDRLNADVSTDESDLSQGVSGVTKAGAFVDAVTPETIQQLGKWKHGKGVMHRDKSVTYETESHPRSYYGYTSNDEFGQHDGGLVSGTFYEESSCIIKWGDL